MNFFKLISLDCPHKIDFPVGTFLFGRGRLIQCDDRRVSRNHGELEVSDNSVTLKSMHVNPCYYIKNGSEEKQVLAIKSSVVLNNGDKFGVLPDNFWYELVYCPNSSNDLITHPTDIPSIENSQSYDNTQPIHGPSYDSIDDNAGDGRDASQHMDFSLNETASNAGAASPSTLNQGNEEVNGLAEPKKPQKRCSPAAPSPVDVKKVKKEPNDEDVKPGPSNANVATDSNTKDTRKNSASNKSPRPRERCMYGANCYRRNPHHKAQFSHPRDPDWGPGQPPCPRRDPRHWRDYRHPPGTDPPPPRRPRHGMRVVERNGNIFYINAHSVNFYDDHFQVQDSDGDSVDYGYDKTHNRNLFITDYTIPMTKKDDPVESESDEELLPEDVVVTGKRPRRTRIQKTSWSDSDSNDDPYKTDESDEWQPSSAGTQDTEE